MLTIKRSKNNALLRSLLPLNFVSYLFFSLILVLTSFGMSTASSFTRSAYFNPVKFTTSEMYNFIVDIEKYIQKTNRKSGELTGHAYFKSDKYRAKLDIPLKESDKNKIPDITYAFELDIRCYNGAISWINLSFDDSSRSLQVSGSDYDLVSGTISIISEKIAPYEIDFGGNRFRAILNIILGVAIFILLSLVFFRLKKTTDIVMATAIAFVVLLALLRFIPWDDLFPGTLITDKKPVFLQEYAPALTLLSIFIPLISGIVKMVVKYLRQPPPTD